MDDHDPNPPRHDLRLRLRTSPALRRAIPLRLDFAVAELRGRRTWERDSVARRGAIDAITAIVAHTERAGEIESLARRRLIEAQANEVFFWRPWRAPELDAESRQNLIQAVSTGRGVILSSCHIGPFYQSMGAVAAVHPRAMGTAGPWLFKEGPGAWGRRVERWRQGIADRGEELVQTGGAFERIAGLLENGEALQLYFDMPGAVQTSFLGKSVALAGGTARLAERAEALVLAIHTRRRGHRAATTIGRALDARDYGTYEELHQAIARFHERAILQTPEQVEDPNRAGAWEGGASAEAWIRPSTEPPGSAQATGAAHTPPSGGRPDDGR